MKLEPKEQFSELTPETDCSLYAKDEMPLYKDSYFCKKMYCPKTMTIETAQELYAEIEDSEIPLSAESAETSPGMTGTDVSDTTAGKTS